jgi:AhpD family alkylhydroperoxidase
VKEAAGGRPFLGEVVDGGVSVEDQTTAGPRIDPEPPERVLDVLDGASEHATANWERAEAILAELDDGEVPETYDERADWGFAFTGALARRPETFELWWAEEGEIFADGALDRGFKELVGAAVAHERGADICIAWHTTSAELDGQDPEVCALAADVAALLADLDPAEEAAVEYGVAVGTDPASISDEDVVRLREYGFDDDAIVELTAAAATAAKFAAFALALDI